MEGGGGKAPLTQIPGSALGVCSTSGFKGSVQKTVSDTVKLKGMIC